MARKHTSKNAGAKRAANDETARREFEELKLVSAPRTRGSSHTATMRFSRRGAVWLGLCALFLFANGFFVAVNADVIRFDDAGFDDKRTAGCFTLKNDNLAFFVGSKRIPAQELSKSRISSIRHMLTSVHFSAVTEQRQPGVKLGLGL